MVTLSAEGIIRLTSGAAIRLVSKKYFGKVPKYRYAIGPVVIWHAIDMHAAVHIHLNPFDTDPLLS